MNQNQEIQLPNFLFHERVKRTTVSLWFKYALIRSLSIEGIRDGIYPTKHFDSIAIKLGVSKRTIERYFKQLTDNGFAIHFNKGYKIISKLKSEKNNVRIPVSLFESFTKGEIFIRELIDKAIKRKIYLKTRNGSAISTTESPENSSQKISLFELELSSGYDKSMLSKSIKAIESKSNLSVTRQKCLNENGFTWNKINEYSFSPVRKRPLNETVKKKSKLTDWFKSLIEEKKESFIILGCISDYYANRKVPYTHYNAILNRIIKNGYAVAYIDQSHWNKIGVVDKREWFTGEKYQYFFFDENGSTIFNQYVQEPIKQEESRIEMKSLLESMGIKVQDKIQTYVKSIPVRGLTSI